tara:strand:+ start:1394 stop:1510 length:117 start_codon:yes stop_codon:yes gene_type:complete
MFEKVFLFMLVASASIFIITATYTAYVISQNKKSGDEK